MNFYWLLCLFTGQLLCSNLIHKFLFPASTMITTLVEESQSTEVLDIIPQCCHSESRVAAYNLLVILCDGCVENLQLVADQLVAMHHGERLKTAKEWEVSWFTAWRDCQSQLCMPYGVVKCRINLTTFFAVSSACHWPGTMWFCWSQECWSNVLYECCYTATLYGTHHKRCEILFECIKYKHAFEFRLF